MSIIYNALQKTQKNLTNRREAPQDRRWLDIILLAIIVCLLLIIVFAYLPKFKKLASKSNMPVIQQHIGMNNLTDKINNTQQPHRLAKPSPINEIDYQGKLVLNGVFLSDQEKVALVNNQPMHIGDFVDGKKIISIELNKIKLQDNANILILRTVS